MREFFAKLFLTASLACMTDDKREGFLKALEDETEHQQRINRDWQRIHEEQVKLTQMMKTINAVAEERGVELPDYSKFH